MPPSFVKPPSDDNSDNPLDDVSGQLKRTKRAKRRPVDTGAVAQSAADNGFTRTIGDSVHPARRRGRPPRGEEMTYWRVYVSPAVRDELIALRDAKGCRLNDLLVDMLEHYRG